MNELDARHRNTRRLRPRIYVAASHRNQRRGASIAIEVAYKSSDAPRCFWRSMRCSAGARRFRNPRGLRLTRAHRLERQIQYSCLFRSSHRDVQESTTIPSDHSADSRNSLTFGCVAGAESGNGKPWGSKTRVSAPIAVSSRCGWLESCVVRHVNQIGSNIGQIRKGFRRAGLPSQ